jgi:hypothetical protein
LALVVTVSFSWTLAFSIFEKKNPIRFETIWTLGLGGCFSFHGETTLTYDI